VTDGFYEWKKRDESANGGESLALLKPCPDEALKAWPVDKAVGNVRNKGAELALPT
jgi:putative SOS response-associated peptidase YedK